jgi:hypothetical protein
MPNKRYYWRKAKYKKYYEENKDWINKRKNKYYKDNRDKMLAYQREYYVNNIGNVGVICWKCNELKASATPQQILLFDKFVRRKWHEK